MHPLFRRARGRTTRDKGGAYGTIDGLGRRGWPEGCSYRARKGDRRGDRNQVIVYINCFTT